MAAPEENVGKTVGIVLVINFTYSLNKTTDQGPLLLTWFNFDPSMDK